MKHLSDWFTTWENDSRPMWHFILFFVLITAVRNTLEGIFGVSGKVALSNDLRVYWSIYIAHYTFSYFCLGLLILIILRISTGTRIDKLARPLILLSPIIWIPPLWDFFFALIAGTEQESIGYMRRWSEWYNALFHMFNLTVVLDGVSRGQRFLVLLVFLSVMGYTFLKTRNPFRTILAGLLFIGMAFCYGYFLVGTQSFYAATSLVGERFNVDQMLGVASILLALLLFLIVYLIDFRDRLWLLLRSFRWSLVGHYMILFIFGVGIAALYSPKPILMISTIKYMYFVGSLVSMFLVFQASVILNNIYDREEDALNNPKRLALLNTIPKTEYWGYALFFLSIALILSFSIMTVIFTIVVASIALSYFYSVPPFRWKRFFPASNLLLGIGATMFSLAGMAFFLSDQLFHHVPVEIFLFLISCFTLGTTLTCVKDYAGDKQAGIRTLATLFSERGGRIAVSIAVFLAFLTFPLLLDIPTLFFTILSILAGSAIALILIRGYAYGWLMIVYYTYGALAIGWLFYFTPTNLY